MLIFEKFAEIQSWLTLRGVDSAQVNTAVINFVFAGLEFEYPRKQIFKKTRFSLFIWGPDRLD